MQKSALGTEVIWIMNTSYVTVILHQPYHTAFTPEQAVQELKRWAGKQFDQVVAAFLRIL